MLFLIALPALVLATVAVRRLWEDGLARAWVAWCVVAAISAEATAWIPGLADRFEIVWAVVLGVALWIILRIRSFPRPTPHVEHVPIALLLGTSLALVSVAPSNWDSMTYHLARVAHWADQGHPLHYATGIDRQLSQPPLAEYLLWQAWGTGLLPIVQWIAGLVAAAGANRAARLLGGDRSAGRWAALFVLTVPMVVCQMSSTQNDLVVAAALIWCATFGLDGWKHRTLSPWIWSALAGALAVATKGTALIIGLPLAVGLAVGAIRSLGSRALIPASVAVVALAVLAGPNALRNASTFGEPLGPDYGLANARFTPGAWISNAVKQTAQELRTPWQGPNRLVERGAHAVHGVLGIDVNDGDLHWPGSPGFRVTSATRGEYFHEDYAPAPIHLTLFLVAAVMLLRFRKDPTTRVWLILLLVAFALYSLILRWQVWHPRLHLPLFVLAAPIVAQWVARRHAITRAALSVLLLVFAGVFALANEARPLVGADPVHARTPQMQQFANRPEALEGYRIAMDHIERVGAKRIGLIASGDAWEYPIWTMRPEGVSIEHLHDGADPFDALLVWRSEVADEPTMRRDDRVYVRLTKGGAGAPALFVARESQFD